MLREEENKRQSESEREGGEHMYITVQDASELRQNSIQSPSRSLSLQSTEISWSDNENSLHTRGTFTHLIYTNVYMCVERAMELLT